MTSTRPAVTATGRRPVRPILLVGGAVLLAAAVIGVAIWLRTLPPVAAFIADHPGPAMTAVAAPEGFPAWVNWQHFFNFFLLALVVRTGLASRSEKRPAGYWSPRGRNGSRTRIRLIVFTHLSLDLLWIVNGVVYVVLLFATGRWPRLVPTDWDVIPSAISVGLQYASLDWPTDNSWVHYNALQQITYFCVVFLLAPASFVTGLRLSPLWPRRLESVFPLERARALHYPLMLAFVIFVIGHVALVLLTGAVKNLNHMYAGSDQESWVGVVMFALALAVTAAAVLAVRPLVIRTWAGLFGSVSR